MRGAWPIPLYPCDQAPPISSCPREAHICCRVEGKQHGPTLKEGVRCWATYEKTDPFRLVLRLERGAHKFLSVQPELSQVVGIVQSTYQT
jgi:hypothetical protein